MKTYFYIFFCLIFVSCENDSYQDLVEVDTVLNLKWHKAYLDDTLDKSLTGLKWALSYVGATLPNHDNGFTIDIENSIIKIDILKLGFDGRASKKLLNLSGKIRVSSEYKITGGVDLGRYISLLLGPSEHYYEFVNTPQTLDELLNNYKLLPEQGYVNNSSVSLEHRIIRFSEQKGFNQIFISEEVDSITGFIYEYETIELLPNGQLRFGIFDGNGLRKNGADIAHSNAGKPAKCIWCHESSINPLFKPQNNYSNFLKANELQDTLLSFRTSHNELKLSLTDGVDYSKTQDHTLTELLYISFMEPSAERLSKEWNLTTEETKEKLKGLETHKHEEFSFLGNLYCRKDIEQFAPFQSVTTPDSIREPSENNINLLN